MSLHINGTEGACGAEVLASATADAAFFVNNGNLQTIGIPPTILELREAICVNHLDGSRRTVTGTIAASDAISEHHAVVTYPHGMTYLS